METSDDLLSVQSRYQWRIHHPHAPARARIVSALARGGTDDLRARAHALGNCCRTPIVYTTTSGRLGTRAGYCRSRVCPLCSQLRELESGKRAAALAKTMDSPRFITLTLREDGQPLQVRLDRLADAWRKLRQQKCWKESVRGGIYGIQVTRGAGGSSWHVHMHVVADGTYFHHSQLRAAWAKATGDSTIVDIRAVPSRSAIATYIARYICCTNAVASWDAAAICEFTTAFHGRRTLHTFGSLHGKVTDAVDDAAPADEVVAEVALAELEERGVAVDEDAACILDVLRRCCWVTRRLTDPPGSHPPNTPRPPIEPWEHANAVAAVERLHHAREQALRLRWGSTRSRSSRPLD